MSRENEWLRLDNSAKIYPMMVGKKSQNIFSISAEMTEDVNPDELLVALKTIIPRFPSFNVRLVRGLFWYYFEENNAEPKVYPENDRFLTRITLDNTDGFNFRVNYYKSRITVDYFHVIADGYGALEFFKSLVYTYLKGMGHNIKGEQRVLTTDTPVSFGEIEDSFIEYYRPKKLRDLKIKELQGKKAFRIPGVPMQEGRKGVIVATMPSAELLSLSRAEGVTLTAYTAGLIMYAIYKCKVKPSLAPDNIEIFLPINLRKIFPSKTLRNFTLFSRVGADVSQDGLQLSYFIEIAKNSIERDTDRELLRDKISTTVKGEKFFPLRVAPLFFKLAIFKISNVFFGKNKKTMTYSNVGIAELPESFRPYVKNIWCGVNCTAATPLNICAITTYDSISFAFTRMIRDTEIERFFVRYLTERGINVTVSSNYNEL